MVQYRDMPATAATEQTGSVHYERLHLMRSAICPDCSSETKASEVDDFFTADMWESAGLDIAGLLDRIAADGCEECNPLLFATFHNGADGPNSLSPKEFTEAMRYAKLVGERDLDGLAVLAVSVWAYSVGDDDHRLGMTMVVDCDRQHNAVDIGYGWQEVAYHMTSFDD